MKIIKYFLMSLAVIIVILVTLPFVIDVNDYKEDIVQAVYQKSGRELQINGVIKLSVFPWMGVSLGATRLGDLVQISNAQVKVKLIPLLSGNVEVSRIVVEGLRLDLITEKDGSNNWEDSSAAKNNQSVDKNSSASNRAGDVMDSLRVDGVEIRDAVVSIKDYQKKTNIRISDISLLTEAIVPGQPFAIALNLKVNGLEGLAAQKQPLALSLKSRINLGKDAIDIEQIRLGLSDSSLTGNIHIARLSQPQIRFDLSLDKINLDDYVEKKDAPVEKKASSHNRDKSVAMPLDALRKLDLKGKFQLGELQVSGVKVRDVKISLLAKKGVMRAYPLTASLYEGRFNGDMKMDFTGSVPVCSMVKEISGVQLGLLLKDAMATDVLSARGDVMLKLNMKGDSPATMRKSLNGTASINLAEGVIKGVDILGTIEDAYNKIKGKASSSAENKKTPFSSFSASANIRNGVLRNDDLQLASPLLSVRGKGKVDLVNERVDYLLTTRISGDTGRGLARLRGQDVPIRVKGSLTDPGYYPDLGSILKSQAKKKLMDKVFGTDKGGSTKDKLKKSLKSLFR
ncbi:MAG: AsmA family protein [Gammaproteobacteria bacterium]|nr:AsmA family protein [Gammaproteobacteria bacterium]